MSEVNKEPSWFVVHTYSGYENKVKDTLEKSAKSTAKMQDLIKEVRVPVEEVTEIRNGRRVKSQRKVYPGYVMIRMIETPESWYLVRNTRGVTGFVGPDGKPVALTEQEVENMLNPAPVGLECNLAIGEDVRIVAEGSLHNFPGTVVEVDSILGRVKVHVQMFFNRTVDEWFNIEDVERREE